MAGLQRFITYIYKYENDEKMENAGFAKIEIRGGMCRIEVHIRNIHTEQTEAIVYLFAEKENIIQGIPVGNIAFAKGNGDIRYAFETKELGNFGMTIHDMEGIFIPLEDTWYLASRWKEGTIEQSRFHIMEKIEKQEESKETETRSETKSETDDPNQENATPGGQNPIQSKSGIPVQEQSKLNAPIQEQSRPNAATQAQERSKTNAPTQDQEQSKPNAPTQEQSVSRQSPPIQATELPLENFFEETSWSKIFQKLRLKSEVFFPFEGQEIECIRMQLNDLQEFPRKYWYIGNNSFLLHGFFNYRHIIFGEMEENGEKKYFIGVPGVFMNQERIMAAMFGFPEFRTAKVTEYKTGNFGYWYRLI